MKKRNLFTVALMLSSISMTAQKIDFDMTNRNTSEVTEPNYIPWAVPRGASDTKTLDNGMTLTVESGHNANGLGSEWNKNTVIAGQRLFGDGVIAGKLDNGNLVKVTEGETSILLTIEGMTPGHHSLLAYHLNNDLNVTLPPIQVDINGKTVLSNVPYTSNKEGIKASDVGRSFVEFDVTEGQKVVIRYKTTPKAGETYTYTSIMINGLEFDVNPYEVMDEIPSNHDLHFDADNGTVNFSWKGADIAVSHKLVYGTDSTAVANATSYQYEGTKAEFSANGFSPLLRYWWRVDEVEANGTVHKGSTRTFQPRRIAFPGAEGYGRFAIGGRGGAVYHVTSLADDGTPGTLRYGIQTMKGPRTIVFDVAGVIELTSRLVCSDKFVTIAGQTAPGRGILLRNKAFGMQSDGITRFLRLYLGGADDWQKDSGPNPNTSDGMGMTGNEHSIMDHCSIAWTIDEAFSSRGAKTLTLQRTMISEALNYAGHSHYAEEGRYVSHGYAATIGGGEMGGLAGSYHHNLLAHCEGRNWSISGGLDGAGYYDGHHDIFNNVVYNWGGRASDGGTHELNFVNNYYKKGPATSQNFLLRHQFEGTGKGSQSAYVSGNIREDTNGTKTRDKEGTTYKYELSGGQKLTWEPWSSTPFFESHATIETAEAAYKNVLSDVGCNMPELNNHDTRIINETLNRTTSTIGRYTGKKGLPDCESDAEGFAGLNIINASRDANWDTDQDGIPNWFESVVGTNPNAANNNDDRDGDNYTDLEEYLNWIAEPNFIINGVKSVDLKTYFAGYKTPTYSIEECPNEVTADINGSILEVDPQYGNAKLFTVKVQASEGGISLVRTFHFAYGKDLTGISSIKGEKPATDNSIYDLQGRKVQNPQKGLYIRNGKKFVVK